MNQEDADIFLHRLETGEISSVSMENGAWKLDKSIKERILRLFKSSPLQIYDMSVKDCQAHDGNDGAYRGRDDKDDEGYFVDKAWIPLRKFSLRDEVRVVPGGSAVRRGAYIGRGCVLMAPCYVNIGAYVGAGTMVDSHALVGSCARVGKNVHISAGVQIGGVLEPVGAMPVIVEDNAFLGASVSLVDSILVRKGAVLAPGVRLSSSSVIYDLVNGIEIIGEVPEGAVVVPGAREVSAERNKSFSSKLSVQCAMIIKYRDESTDAATALEGALR